MLTFAQLRDALAQPPFLCDCVCVIPADEITDPAYPDTVVPAVFAFTRSYNGKTLVATVPVYHQHLQLKAAVVMSALARLAVTPEDLK